MAVYACRSWPVDRAVPDKPGEESFVEVDQVLYLEAAVRSSICFSCEFYLACGADDRLLLFVLGTVQYWLHIANNRQPSAKVEST